jgi:hypothetical protein
MDVMKNNVMEADWMECAILALVFVVVSHHRTQDLVKSTIRNIMPNLELEDEDGNATLLQLGIQSVLFVGLWFLLGELNLRGN